MTKIIEPNADNGKGLLKAEVIAGRSTWLFSMLHILTITYKILENHSWSIIRSPQGIKWLTSDNPVIRLNYYASGSYDFKGGWGNNGTEILFPISPNLLLYTKVGDEKRYKVINKQFAQKLQYLIAENAHRFIFSSRSIPEIEMLRPRVIDSDAFRYERDTWEKWHQEQREVELKLMKREK